MVQVKDLPGTLRIVDGSGQVVAEFNTANDQRWYIWDFELSQLSAIEFGATNTGSGKKPLLVPGDVTADSDLERFSGTATAGSGTTITLPTGATESSSIDDFHNGSLIQLTGGTGSGQNQRITDYNGTTRVATVTSFSPAPDATTTYEINCTNFYTDDPNNAVSTQWGRVKKPITGQNTIDGDADLYPSRIRIHPRIVDDESLRYESILFTLHATTQAGEEPGYKRWEWLIDYKSIPGRLIDGPYLLNETPDRNGRRMTATISDIVLSPAAGSTPAWLEFTITMTTEENGIATWGDCSVIGIS